WFQDEARFGQKGTLTRIWSKKNERVGVPRSCGYEWTYFFGSLCPLKGTTHGLLLPYADLEGMQVYLDDFARTRPADVFTLLICDRAGWHTSGKLRLPHNLMLLPLPPKSPELNPAELLWREMRQKQLGNRVFPDVDLMHGEICKAWLRVTENPQSIQSLCGFKWITDMFK
ncbi:MAG: IS630 family transposase, partial [Planctomycetota bacterium]|nr:IS630 family transposase [Planctomycetota bacterium]